MLRALEPNRPLDTGELERLYVERPDDTVRARLHQLLRAPGAKVVLWGQPGAGKTTELLVLTRDLAADSQPIEVRPGRLYDLGRVGMNELLAGGASDALMWAQQHGFQPSDALKQRAVDWGAEWHQDTPEQPGWFALDPAVPPQRTLGLILQETAAAIEEIEAAFGRPVILIYDGLEQLPLDTVRSFFATNGEALLRWPVRAVFVVPPLLVYMPEWSQAERHVSDAVFLPALPISDRLAGPAAVAFLETVANRRISAVKGSLAPALLHRAIETSGGLPRQLIQILREAFLEASLAGRSAPDARCLDVAIARLCNSFLLRLRPANAQRLHQIATAKPASIAEEDYPLLATSLILQYQAGDRLWHDANPILAPVLASY